MGLGSKVSFKAYLKFGSSMTLFARASDEPGSVFRRALEQFCGGEEDGRTIARLAG